MSYEAGTAFLQVVPSFAGVVDGIAEEFTKDGEVAGQAFKDSFETAVRNMNGSVNLDTRTADERLAELDAEIKSLRESVGVSISDDEALAKVAFLKAALADLSGNIDMKTGAGMAAELDAIAKSAQDVSGPGGLGGFVASAGEATSDISVMIPLVGLLATTIGPLAGLAAGALSTLPAILGGLGLGFAAIALSMSKIKAVAAGIFDPLVKSLQPLVVGAILPGVKAGLEDIVPLFKSLTPFIVGAAGAIGSLAQRFGEFLGSTQGISEIGTILTAGSNFLAPLGENLLTLTTAFATIGAQATPIVAVLSAGITNLVNAFARWVEGGGFESFLHWLQQNGPPIVAALANVVKAVAGLIVALAPVGVVVIRIVGYFAQFVGWLAKSPALLGAVTAAIGALGIALVLAMDTNPIGLIITAIALLIVGITELVTHWSTIWAAIKQVADAAWQWFDTNVAQPLVTFFTATVPAALATVGAAFASAWAAIKNAVVTAWQAVDSNVIQPIVTFFTATIPAALATVGAAFASAWSAITGAVTAAWSAIYGNVIAPIVTFFMSTIPGAIGAVVGAFASMPGRIGGAISGLFGLITGAFGDVAGWVNTNVIQKVAGFFGALPGDILHALGDLGGLLVNAGKQLIAGLKSGIMSGLASIKSAIGGIPVVGGIVSALTGGFLADGGPAEQGLSYIVGERGPELFVPNVSGTIVPNHSLSQITASGGTSQPQRIYSPTFEVQAFDPASAAVLMQQRSDFAAKTRGF